LLQLDVTDTDGTGIKKLTLAIGSIQKSKGTSFSATTIKASLEPSSEPSLARARRL
jgi:hypothetical protein